MTDTSYARISKMLRGRRAVRVMQLPGIEVSELVVDVGVRILTDEEIDECHSEATEYVREMAKKIHLSTTDMLDVDPEILDRERTRCMIFKAFVDPEPNEHGQHKQFFPNPRAVRQLDTVIVRTLFEAYLEQQNYVSPLRTADEEELAELADALGKGLNAEVILSQYDAPTLRTLLHSLAAELSTLLGPKSSGS